jgi:quercetin dioxygenase-like cupin family protein
MSETPADRAWIVTHAETEPRPFRPGYTIHRLAGAAQGLRCAAVLSVLDAGAGAPLHVHPDVDEVLVVLEGTLDVRRYMAASRRRA